jgi:hypothetical protein
VAAVSSGPCFHPRLCKLKKISLADGEVFINYAVETGSDVIICIPSFIKIGSGIQKLMGEDPNTDTHRQEGDLISLLLFFRNKERI